MKNKFQYLLVHILYLESFVIRFVLYQVGLRQLFCSIIKPEQFPVKLTIRTVCVEEPIWFCIYYCKNTINH